MPDSEWLFFRHEESKPKTEVWRVYSKSSGALLGEIKWLGRWRQYTFWPASETTFNVGCMEDITNFVRHQNEFHRELKRA